jgi:hypothetical protein
MKEKIVQDLEEEKLEVKSARRDAIIERKSS